MAKFRVTLKREYVVLGKMEVEATDIVEAKRIAKDHERNDSADIEWADDDATVVGCTVLMVEALS